VHPQDTKCTPQLEQESILGHFLLGGLDLEVYLDRLLRATTKKVVNFFDEKSAPQTKSWLRLCFLDVSLTNQFADEIFRVISLMTNGS